MKNRKQILLIALVFSLMLQGQSVVITSPQTFHIRKRFVPPQMEIVEGSVEFNDVNKNGIINANEKNSITLRVRNNGEGDAVGCRILIEGSGSTQGISFKEIALPTIGAHTEQTINIPIISNIQTTDGVAKFDLHITEPYGYASEDIITLRVKTHEFDAPNVRVVSYKLLGGDKSGKLRKNSIITMQLVLQNTGQGDAHNVKMDVALPDNIMLSGGDNEHFTLDKLESGEALTLSYDLAASTKAADKVEVGITLRETYGMYAEDSSIPIVFGQSASSHEVTVNAKEQEKRDIKVVTLISDVDENIPLARNTNDKTFAVVIANEQYQKVADVRFAFDDGRVFAEYCKYTLGIPEHNIHFVANATLGNIRSEVDWIRKVIDAYNGNAKVIFYYAGHGIPDEKNKTAYLLPTDGNASDMSTAFKLDELYRTLGSLSSEKVLVFLDACFSGSQREMGEKMLVEARGVAVAPKRGIPQGNTVVFSAAQGDETALPYVEQHHGMFTYFLLKKLQETKGEVSLSELEQYIKDNVSQRSIVVNRKSQTPCVIPSAVVGTDWQRWTLK